MDLGRVEMRSVDVGLADPGEHRRKASVPDRQTAAPVGGRRNARSVNRLDPALAVGNPELDHGRTAPVLFRKKT
jgi:hypothetical protein